MRFCRARVPRIAHFPFETLRVSNHATCRFAKNTFFPCGFGRAALCRCLAFCLFQRQSILPGDGQTKEQPACRVRRTSALIKARWGRDGGAWGEGEHLQRRRRGSPSPQSNYPGPYLTTARGLLPEAGPMMPSCSSCSMMRAARLKPMLKRRCTSEMEALPCSVTKACTAG